MITTSVFITVFSLRKHITVNINGHDYKFITYRKTIRKALETNGIKIGSKDRSKPSLDSEAKNNQYIILKKAVKLNIAFDGKQIHVMSSESSIENMLKAEKIKLGKLDKVSPDRKLALADNMNIKITRVEIKYITESRPILFKIVLKRDHSIPNTRKFISREGKCGTREVTTRYIFEDGDITSRKVVKQRIIKNCSDKIVIQGTYPLMPVSRGGEPMPYYRVYTARTTAYWAVRGVGRTYTGSGRLAVRNSDGFSTVAVDRRVLPYGTKIFIEGYGFAVAADSGSAITGTTIDVFFNTRQEACNWAVKHVKVYILK